MTSLEHWNGRLAVMLAVGILTFSASIAAAVAPALLKGKFEELKEPSTHTPGKVKITEFADFYCPHCHLFEQAGLPVLEKEFGNKIEVTMVGFPVIPGKLPTAFEMYEQARMMGKGAEMKKVLFRTVHKDKLQILDKVIRGSLIEEVGLDVAAFEAGLASGKPARAVEEGKAWGRRVNVQQTPTLLLDGNIKVEAIDPDNLKTIIRSILEADRKR
ncbi:MAG TPA: thioredoxin domain-containing protein [Candidatus Acidoferrum sp.]|nr:thioredoxin domain-containing protein [Candidatus Acidoferrum sp.]